MKSVLTIAGSDCSGGAGIQADIKTITAHKLYAMSAITALTAQNTKGVQEILEVPPSFLEKQLLSVFEDIPPDAVKIGMAVNAQRIEVIADILTRYHAKNIVLDPVLLSTSNRRLLDESAMDVLIKKLFPLCTVITPNIPEAEVLSGICIHSSEDMITAAEQISREGKTAVLIKGGHAHKEANDLLYLNKEPHWFHGRRIANTNTHGTGCTLSSAIACNLAMGENVNESVKNAKQYITGAIEAGLDLGEGNGPLSHGYWIHIDKSTKQ